MNAGHKWQTVTFLAASAVMAISLAAAAAFEDEAWQQMARANTAEAQAAELAAKVDELSAALASLPNLPAGLTASYAVAADLSVLPLGTVVYIEGGRIYPNSLLHRSLPAYLRHRKRHYKKWCAGHAWRYIGVRVVQDTGGALQGQHLDVAVNGTHADALCWPMGGQLAGVWILSGKENELNAST